MFDKDFLLMRRFCRTELRKNELFLCRQDNEINANRKGSAKQRIKITAKFRNLLPSKNVISEIQIFHFYVRKILSFIKIYFKNIDK